MITIVKWNALFSLSLLLSLVLAAQVPPAAASGSEIELEAELSNYCPTCTAVPKLKGEAGYEKEFRSDGTTIKEAEIEAQVQIPIPNTLGIDATNAGTASCTIAARVAVKWGSSVYQRAYPKPEVTAPETAPIATPLGFE